MLDAVYVDAKEGKAVVAIRPKPAFRPVFEIATTREGSNVALITTTPPDFFSPEALNSCSWWRRGSNYLECQVFRPVTKLFAYVVDPSGCGV